MKAIINPTLVGKELKKCSLVVNRNTIIPILECVKLHFSKNVLTITITDLETTMISKVTCECKDDFVIIVAHSSFLDVLSKENTPLSIELLKSGIQLKSDDAVYKLPIGGGVTEFPVVPDEEFDFSFAADVNFFAALYGADQCKNINDMLVTTNTACIDFKGDIISVVGTDAFVFYKKDFKIKTNKVKQSLVRSKFVHAVKDFEEAKISVSEKFVKADNGTISIITRAQDNKYCQYEIILKKDINYNVEFNRRDFIYALTKASITSSKATKMCAINFNGNPNLVKISSVDVDFEKEGEVSLRGIHEVSISAIGVNSAQLLKLLNLLESENVKLAIESETKSVYLKNDDCDDVLCLIQPLMLNQQ